MNLLLFLLEAIPPGPALDPIVEFLLKQGTTAAVMMAVNWVLIRHIFSQYESRISALEEAVDAAKGENLGLHKRIEEIQAERIRDLQEQLTQSGRNTT